MPPPVVATSSNDNSHMNAQKKEEAAPVKEEDKISKLQKLFPMVEGDQIKTFLELMNGDTKKTRNFIQEQLNIEVVDEEDQVDPEDIEFNMLAGNQVDPNAITEEEKKMIQQALRESDQQESQIRQSAQNQARNVQQNARNVGNNIEQEANNVENQTRMKVKEINGNEVVENLQNSKNKDKSKKKKQKKVDKKDGNNC